MPVLAEAGQQDFERSARILRARAGIVIGTHKHEMVARTLGLRAKGLGLRTIKEYLDFLEHNPATPEWDSFINAFTINHTAFFREQHHFDILSKFAKSRKKPFSVWCAAASTGEEPYTIAMTLREAFPQSDNSVSVVATDIDTNAIERAQAGVYSVERAQPVPEEYLKKYFQRGAGSQAGMVRVKPNIRSMIEFATFNLLSTNWPTDRKFDAIFCRNTMIYFDKPTQTRILERFAPLLKPGGLLFAGHSENFTYLTQALRLQGQTVYVRTEP